MKIAVHAVGRMKTGPERDLAGRYFDRFARSGPAIGLEFAGVAEIVESKAATADDRRRDEASRVRAQIGAGSVLVVLDERGTNLASSAFAERIGSWRDGGNRGLSIAIGGPDGHDAALRKEAALVLSLGQATWPHQLVRIMLAEQLYRAVTILSGHPYHRA